MPCMQRHKRSSSVLFAKDVTDSVCRNWFRLEGWGGLIVVVVVQGTRQVYVVSVKG